LLSQHSILAQTVGADGSLEQADHRDSFIGGVRDGANGNLLHDCFSIRARHLLGHASKSSNFHRLSGLLIGAELKEITTREPAGLWLVSGTELQPFYAAAIRALFPTLPITSCDADEALLHGQRTIALRVGLLQNLLETSSAPVRTD
jgi:2-dehydro-3-deoxygalactonokinase